MPRELIHWRVVQSVLEHPRVRDNPELFSLLHREKLSVYLGSLAHDVPYYFHAGHHPFERVADKLHGREGEDTFELLRKLAAIALTKPESEQLVLWPFLFGMLTHMAADIVFHPMIFYFTGNYHDLDPAKERAAQARHRLLEVYIESWIRPRVRFSWGVTLRDLFIQNRKRNNLAIAGLLDEVLTPELLWPNEFPDPPKPLWLSGFRQLGFYQRLFVSQPIGAAFRVLSNVYPRGLKGIDALLSFGRSKPEALFDVPLAYRNPVTGENAEMSIDEMLVHSVEVSIDFMEHFQTVIHREATEVEQVLAAIRGPSLNFGVLSAHVEDALFFSDRGLPLKGLTLARTPRG